MAVNNCKWWTHFPLGYLFRLRILAHLLRRSVYFEHFPVGRAKTAVTISILTEIFGIFGSMINNPCNQNHAREITRNVLSLIDRKKASLLWLVICCTISFEPITEHIVKKSDNNEVWSFLCWIPLSNSSCKVLSMNFTAESHCCFSLTDQSSSAVSWITLWEDKNILHITMKQTAVQFPTDTFRCFRFLFLDWPKTKLHWRQSRQRCHVTITCNCDWLRRLGDVKSITQGISVWLRTKQVQGWFCVKTYFFLPKLTKFKQRISRRWRIWS